MKFEHIPVLLNEVLEGLDIKENGIYVDGTIGGAGHSLEIVKRLSTSGRLIGIDQDKNALKKASEVLAEFDDKVRLVHSNYENIDSVLDELDIGKVDSVLLDIGVSSHQFDEEQRGFSYNKDALLDMRMDRTSSLTAWDVVNKYEEKEIEQIIWDYGEERWARRIAEFIVKERKKDSIDTTFQLVTAIKKAIPSQVRRETGHPARKTFQAIRIEVNRELDVLTNGIPKIIKSLKPGGILAIITFHSLEDRIVKNIYRDLYRDCICPPELPQCICEKYREIEIITRRPIVPTEEEIFKNPRSRSAKLRLARKI